MSENTQLWSSSFCLGACVPLFVYGSVTALGVTTPTSGVSGSELVLLGIGVLLIGVLLAIEEVAKNLNGAREIIWICLGALNNEENRWHLMATDEDRRVRSRIRRLLNLNDDT